MRKQFYLITLLIIACDYKAGNRVPGVDFEIVSNINTSLIFKYLDSFPLKEKYALPEKYNFLYTGGGDLEYFPESNKLIFFNQYPLEGYVISLQGYTMLTYIYNPAIDSFNFVIDKNKIDNASINRINSRLKLLYLEVVEKAKQNKEPDSLIYMGLLEKRNNQKDSIYVELNY